MNKLTRNRENALNKWFFDDWDNLFSISPFRFSSFKPTGFTPSVDIYEEDNQIILSTDLPGMKIDDVNIEINDGVIYIKGEKKSENETKSKTFYRSERSYGSFTRSFTLPENIDEENIKASYQDGVLKVSIPKLQQVETRETKKIPIQT